MVESRLGRLAHGIQNVVRIVLIDLQAANIGIQFQGERGAEDLGISRLNR